MPKHSETRHLPYTPEQMFDLVADVARYPEFLPWVSAMRVRSNSDTETVADMIVESGIGRIPIVDRETRAVVGILSRQDLLKTRRSTIGAELDRTRHVGPGQRRR